MLSMRFIALALVVSAFFAAGAPFGAPSASAASIYDDVITVGGDFTVSNTFTGSGGACGASAPNEQDLYSSWASLITDPTAYAPGQNTGLITDAITAYNDALTAGTGWGVLQYTNTNNGSSVGGADMAVGDQALFVVWNAVDNQLTFGDYASNPALLSGTDTYNARIVWYNNGGNCELKVASLYKGAGPLQPTSITGTAVTFLNFDIIYPAGYEGEIAPDSPPVPPVIAEITPDISIQSILNWHVTAHDLNFNTFDKVPFTCTDDGNNVVTDESGLTPVMSIEIYNSSNVLIDSGTISPTVPFEFDVPKLESDNDYTIITKYDCGGTVEFPNSDELLFTVNQFGSELVDVTPCFNPADITDFDINECLQAFYNILDNLMFNTVKVGGADISDKKSGCYTLGTLGDWLNVPTSSRTICPQFPDTIRNIVTPFVTFLLGLIVMRSIINKSSRSDL